MIDERRFACASMDGMSYVHTLHYLNKIFTIHGIYLLFVKLCIHVYCDQSLFLCGKVYQKEKIKTFEILSGFFLSGRITLV